MRDGHLRRRRNANRCAWSRAVALARFATPLLKKEHDYLTRAERVVRVDVPRTSAAHKITGDYADMARYWAFTDQPRPESFREDTELALAAFPEGADPDGEKKRRLFRDVASAAETARLRGADGSAIPSGARERSVTSQCLEASLPDASRIWRWRLGRSRVDPPAAGRAVILSVDAQGERPRVSAGEVRDEDVRCGTWRGTRGRSSGGTVRDRRRAKKAVLNAVLWDERRAGGATCCSANPRRPATRPPPRLLQHGVSRRIPRVDYVPLFCSACDRDSKRAVSVVRSLEKSGMVMPGGVRGVAAAGPATGGTSPTPGRRSCTWSSVPFVRGGGGAGFGSRDRAPVD